MPGVEEGRAPQGLAEWSTGGDTMLGMEATDPRAHVGWNERNFGIVLRPKASYSSRKVSESPRNDLRYIFCQPGGMESGVSCNTE